MRAWALAAMCALGLASGCGARQAAIADTVLTEACDQAITKCVDCYESDKCSAAQAAACVQCTHHTCDVVAEQIWERAEGGEQ